MKLFEKLNEMLTDGSTMTITIAKKGEHLIVGVLPGNDLVKDAAKGKIVPLNLSGTPEDLDNGFIEAIEVPMTKANGLLADMASFEKAQEEAKAKSKMESEKKAVEDKRKKEFSDWVDLAKQNLKENKFRDSLTCIANARKVASDPDKVTLDKLEAEVAQHSGSGSMFGEEEDLSDGKNIKLAGKAKDDKKSKTKKNDEDEDDNEDEEGGDE